MTTSKTLYSTKGCGGCGPGDVLGFDFSMAFQPIVNVATGTVFAHEALVRGPDGESAASVLGQVTDANRYRFDQACRTTAIRLAAGLGMTKPAQHQLLTQRHLPAIELHSQHVGGRGHL